MSFLKLPLSTEALILLLVFTLNALFGIWVYNEQFLLMLIFFSFVALVHTGLSQSVREDATDRIKQMYAATIDTEFTSLTLLIQNYISTCQFKYFILNYRKVLLILAIDLRWYFSSLFKMLLSKALLSTYFESTLLHPQLLSLGNSLKLQKEYSLLYYLNTKL